VAGRFLQEENGKRIGLFAGCAARDPYPDSFGCLLVLKQLRYDIFGDLLERFAVAEKVVTEISRSPSKASASSALSRMTS